MLVLLICHSSYDLIELSPVKIGGVAITKLIIILEIVGFLIRRENGKIEGRQR